MTTQREQFEEALKNAKPQEEFSAAIMLVPNKDGTTDTQPMSPIREELLKLYLSPGGEVDDP